MVLRPEKLEGSQHFLFQLFNSQDSVSCSERCFRDCFMVPSVDQGTLIATRLTGLILAQPSQLLYTDNSNTMQFIEHTLFR